MLPQSRSSRERYASAVQSDDLLPTHADLAALVSAGWAARHHSLGVSWIRVRDGQDAKEYHRAMDALNGATLRRIRVSRLKVSTGPQARSPTPEEVARVVKVVAHWFLNNLCPRCFGRRRLVVPNTPTLGAICSHCRGTGRIEMERSVAAQLGRVWVEVARAAQDVLDGSTRSAAGQIRRGMR